MSRIALVGFVDLAILFGDPEFSDFLRHTVDAKSKCRRISYGSVSGAA